MSVQNAAASLSGSSTVTASTKVVAVARAAFAGLATSTFTSDSGDKAACSLRGLGLFYVDPTKVLLIPFFKATAVPRAYVAPTVPALRPQAPSGAQSSVTISLNRSPPQTKKGGVKNEG